jgi:hypothetical protein
MKGVKLLCALLLFSPLLFAQDFGFGFGDDGDEASASASASSGTRFPLSIGGELSAQALMYRDAVKSWDGFASQNMGNMIRGKIDFSAETSAADGFFSLTLDTVDLDHPADIDEAYIRLYASALKAELGLRKLSWGRADSMGPLDVINPLDYSDLTDITNQLGMKIARPMVRLTYSLGDFTAIEGVFIPWFEAHKFDTSGQWIPSQLSALPPAFMSLYTDKKERLDYAQGGLRFTTTIGSADLGLQYYTGNFFRPAISLNVARIPSPGAAPKFFGYNRYHQIGADYAQVLAGFNVRSELGVNLTEDFSGDDPDVENPAIVYSLGFDRDLFLGINL